MKLSKLLQQKRYKSQNYYTENKVKEFEKLYDYGGIVHLFDDLKAKLDRVPTQTEYIETGLGMAKQYFTQNREIYIYQLQYCHTFEWNEKLIANVKDRLARTYRSRLIEVSVEEYLRSRQIKYVSDELIDLKFGVDIVVKNDEKLYYIHIMSKGSNYRFHQKKNRKSYVLKNNKKIYWTRNWGSAHVSLVFDVFDSSKMSNVNENFIFNEEYLDLWFSELFKSGESENLHESEFNEFFNWIKINDIEFKPLKNGVRL